MLPKFIKSIRARVCLNLIFSGTLYPITSTANETIIYFMKKKDTPKVYYDSVYTLFKFDNGDQFAFWDKNKYYAWMADARASVNGKMVKWSNSIPDPIYMLDFRNKYRKFIREEK